MNMSGHYDELFCNWLSLGGSCDAEPLAKPNSALTN